MLLPTKVGAIEISGDAVRVAVVRTGGRRPQILDLAQAPLANGHEATPEERLAALRAATGQVRIAPAVWVLVVPAARSIFRQVTVPFTARGKVAAAVPFELEPNLAVPIEDLVVDYLPSRTSDKETEVLAVGLKRDALAEDLRLLAEADVPVEGVYLDALALTSLWHRVERPGAGAYGVLHFRDYGAVLGIVEDQRISHLRRIEIDAKSLGSNPQGIAQHVSNHLRAFSAERGAAEIAALVVTGASTLEAGRTLFESELDISVRYVDLAAELPGATEIRLETNLKQDEGNRWASLIAAAAQASGGPFHLDFFREEFAGTSARREFAKVALVSCIAGALVTGTYLALAFVDYRRSAAQLDEMGAAVWREFEATFPDLAFGRPPDDVGGRETFALMQEAAQAEVDQSMGLSLEAFSAPPLVDVLLEISEALPLGVATINSISTRRTRTGQIIFVIQGDIRNPERYNTALEKLDASDIIDVDRDRARRTSQAGHESFTLELRV